MQKSSRGVDKYKNLKPLRSRENKDYLLAELGSRKLLKAIFDYALANPTCIYGRHALLCYDRRNG